MGKINGARVILGGLAAGLIINISEFLLNSVILQKDMDAAVGALNRQVGGTQIAMFTGWAFLTGIFAVWLYAAIRPRYGAGPKTAITAGFAVWCLGYLLAAVTPFALKLFPANVIATGLVVGLVEVILGTLLGAKLYREEDTQQSHKAATA
jgi:MFS family permease